MDLCNATVEVASHLAKETKQATLDHFELMFVVQKFFDNGMCP